MLSYRLKLPPPIGYGLLRKIRIRDSLVGKMLGVGFVFHSNENRYSWRNLSAKRLV
jgi:hypothetical protein